jgi:hypothetical protein
LSHEFRVAVDPAGLGSSTFTLATRHRKHDSSDESADSESAYRSAYLSGALALVQLLADPNARERLLAAFKRGLKG